MSVLCSGRTFGSITSSARASDNGLVAPFSPDRVTVNGVNARFLSCNCACALRGNFCISSRKWRSGESVYRSRIHICRGRRRRVISANSSDSESLVQDGDESSGEESAKARVPQDGPEGALRRKIGSSSSSSDELLNGCIAEFLPPSEQKVFIKIFRILFRNTVVIVTVRYQSPYADIEDYIITSFNCHRYSR